MALDIDVIRRQFPILSREINGKPLIYLDNAATSQKPHAVLDAMNTFYKTKNSNPHRGMHVLAEEATIEFEDARKTVQKFINAARSEEIIFTKNCTEAINLVARSFGSTLVKGDVVVLSILEHHSNIVPWLQLKEERGIVLKWIDCDDQGRLKTEDLDRFLAEGNVKLVAVTAQSNVLGVRPDIKTIVKKAHAAGALVFVDATQWIAHHATNVQELDCDFLTFSGHKLYGPTGIGVLYGKRKLLEELPPFLGGGMMIHEVSTDSFTSTDIPQKFEAGSQPVAEAVGLAATIEWLSQYSWEDIEKHEKKLLQTALDELKKIEGLHLLGPANIEEISGCISFEVNSVHPHDLTDIIGKEGICMRAGHHCTQPLHRRLGVDSSARLSVAIYNSEEEIRTTAKQIANARRHLLN